MSGPAISTTGLGKRYGRAWALEDCSIEVPEGRISGLVGANGAGKSTLLRLLAGLGRPSAGTALVAGREPADDREFLADVGFLAQEVPLYGSWNAEDHLRMGAALNPRWDGAVARERLDLLGIPLGRQIRRLSGGMRAQVALALALGKRPRVLLLDEPVAALDPLARREFLGSLVGAVADGGVTVLLSSHLLPDLERVCDHLILVSDGRPVLCDDIDVLVDSHKLLTPLVPDADLVAVARGHRVVRRTGAGAATSLVVELGGPVLDPAWRVGDLALEDIVLAHLGDRAERRLSLAGASA